MFWCDLHLLCSRLLQKDQLEGSLARHFFKHDFCHKKPVYSLLPLPYSCVKSLELEVVLGMKRKQQLVNDFNSWNLSHNWKCVTFYLARSRNKKDAPFEHCYFHPRWSVCWIWAAKVPLSWLVNSWCDAWSFRRLRKRGVPHKPKITTAG